MIMYNKKYFIIFFSTIFLAAIINLFLDVKVEFLATSLVEYRKYSLNCGSVYQILIEGLEYTDKNLRMNDVVCYNNAVIKVFNTVLVSIFVFFVLKFGIRYIDNKSNIEDISDLLKILKNRNSK